MAGGPEAALQAGAPDIETLRLPVIDGTAVVDLGAGFGMHAIPLARRGVRVTAIDSSPELLRTLAHLAGDAAVQVVNDDLLSFQAHITVPPSVILCMGDTIAHLPDRDAVEIWNTSPRQFSCTTFFSSVRPKDGRPGSATTVSSGCRRSQ